MVTQRSAPARPIPRFITLGNGRRDLHTALLQGHTETLTHSEVRRAAFVSRKKAFSLSHTKYIHLEDLFVNNFLKIVCNRRRACLFPWPQ